jgi:hypothetical protein
MWRDEAIRTLVDDTKAPFLHHRRIGRAPPKYLWRNLELRILRPSAPQKIFKHGAGKGVKNVFLSTSGAPQ